MKELILEKYLTCDYIYIPIQNEELNIRETKEVYKCDLITNYKGENIYSPVSGKIYGIGKINTTRKEENVLVLINDFKDKTEKKIISKENIYKVDKILLDKILYKIKLEKQINLIIPNIPNHTLLLKDNINEILETLNLIEEKYKKEIKIILNKNDIVSYQTLFSYLGTYPNITISFEKGDGFSLTLYDIIDFYNEIKNKVKRDFIYITLSYNNETKIIKTKRYSNLKEILDNFDCDKEAVINKKIKLTDNNFLLDETVNLITIN